MCCYLFFHFGVRHGGSFEFWLNEKEKKHRMQWKHSPARRCLPQRAAGLHDAAAAATLPLN